MCRTRNGDAERTLRNSQFAIRNSKFLHLDCRGFTFVALAIIIFIMGLSLTIVKPTWTVVMKIERETELLYIGKAFRDAIKSYYDAGPPNNKTLPARMEDLLSDPRTPSVKRHLRKVYRDPMTGENDWVLVYDGAQRIRGIHSRSETEPFKKDHFPDEFQHFASKKKYSEWVFEYSTALQPATQPGTQQPQGQAATTMPQSAPSPAPSTDTQVP